METRNGAMVIHLICGARPNFMKIAPLYHALRNEPWAEPIIVHTGQHYDPNMSDAFFQDLNLPVPDVYLGVGSGTHAEQTARVMVAYEQILLRQRPDLVVVVGDVNSSMAATLAASKLGVKVAHLEAGLRSFDRDMPEEINRVVTDALADILWPPSPDGVDHLIREGIARERIQLVGNIMIDSLEMLREKIERQEAYRDFALTPLQYGVVTLHRPSNVDDPSTLKKVCGILNEISKTLPLVFPVHPRTRSKMEQQRLLVDSNVSDRLLMPEPLSYIRFMSLVFHCRLAITDSGGLQEETTYLGIPCLTLRKNTERPITVTHGTNQLCNLDELADKALNVVRDGIPRKEPIELWDGRTASRIVLQVRNMATVPTGPLLS
jgi:UDP-N-acetylglucosamine 2-epimerase (non-hydrolysing)